MSEVEHSDCKSLEFAAPITTHVLDLIFMILIHLLSASWGKGLVFSEGLLGLGTAGWLFSSLFLSSLFLFSRLNSSLNSSSTFRHGLTNGRSSTLSDGFTLGIGSTLGNGSTIGSTGFGFLLSSLEQSRLFNFINLIIILLLFEFSEILWEIFKSWKVFTDVSSGCLWICIMWSFIFFATSIGDRYLFLLILLLNFLLLSSFIIFSILLFLFAK